MKCFHYGEMGHFFTRCPMKKKTRDDEKKKGKQAANVATFVETYALTRRLEEEDFAMISHFLRGTIDEDGWQVDNGASKHMTGSQEVFKTSRVGLEVAHDVGRQELEGYPRIGGCVIQDGVGTSDAGPGCTVCIETQIQRDICLCN